jgi:hypothetical protein
MNATPTAPTPSPLAVSIQGGTLQEVTTILQDAINVAGMFPAAAPSAALAGLILQIISAAASRIRQETGKPIDLSKIPYEQPLP